MRLSVACLLWLLSFPARAQSPYVSEGPSQALYEGQTVSSLTLVADPHLDVGDLRSLVTLQPGSPFSGQQAQASIAALKAAGKFTSVNLTITPGVAGLQLSFVLRTRLLHGSGRFSRHDTAIFLHPTSAGRETFPTKVPTTKGSFRPLSRLS